MASLLGKISSLDNASSELEQDFRKIEQMLELFTAKAEPEGGFQMSLLDLYREWRTTCQRALMNALIRATALSSAVKAVATNFEAEFMLVLSDDQFLDELPFKQELLGFFSKAIAQGIKDSDVVIAAFDDFTQKLVSFKSSLLRAIKEFGQDSTAKELTKTFTEYEDVLKHVEEKNTAFSYVFTMFRAQLDALNEQFDILDKIEENEGFDEEVRAVAMGFTLLRQAISRYQSAIGVHDSQKSNDSLLVF